MCGIVGAVAERNITAILLEGLRRLEYRGYDSAGIALLDGAGHVQRKRRSGKVAALSEALAKEPLAGQLGIAHTRWATHGAPVERNAHPHFSGQLALVHNGIIENHEVLRARLLTLGYAFESDTDTEVIAHLLSEQRKTTDNLTDALKAVVRQLEGAYGLAVISEGEDCLLAARSGSPLVIGLGHGENFLASDPLALRQVTDRFVYLEEGDLAEIRRDRVQIWNAEGEPVTRETVEYTSGAQAAEKGQYRHFMLKEIHEQPAVMQRTLEGRLGAQQVVMEAFGEAAGAIFSRVKNVQIVACGTSFNAGMVARYWLEAFSGIACQVEVASEFRYRQTVTAQDCLLVCISQSGETADTLAALRKGNQSGYLASLAVCNVPTSSLVREADLHLLAQAGPEIGVASTKAFTTQLVGLLLLCLALGRARGTLDAKLEAELVDELRRLPARASEVLALEKTIERIAERFSEKQHSLFLGRGSLYPVALEGALKLKEISYIHAEAYPAGELKHGPLALVDADMPVIAVAPNNELLDKLKSNLQEVRARGGEILVFSNAVDALEQADGQTLVKLPAIHQGLAPILYTLPLQLLAYHVAVHKGTDVDQPRNLAKSVTVE